MALDTSYLQRRERIEHYFDRTAADAWARLTSSAPVSGIRATVRAGRDRMRSTLLDWLPADLRGRRLLDAPLFPPRHDLRPQILPRRRRLVLHGHRLQPLLLPVLLVGARQLGDLASQREEVVIGRDGQHGVVLVAGLVVLRLRPRHQPHLAHVI